MTKNFTENHKTLCYKAGGMCSSSHEDRRKPPWPYRIPIENVKLSSCHVELWVNAPFWKITLIIHHRYCIRYIQYICKLIKNKYYPIQLQTAMDAATMSKCPL